MDVTRATKCNDVIISNNGHKHTFLQNSRSVPPGVSHQLLSEREK